MSKFTRLTNAVRTRDTSTAILVSAVVAVVIIANIVLYMLASTFGWYLYKTEEIDLSISNASEPYFAEALKRVEEDKKLGIKSSKVTINFCMAKDEIINHDPGKYVHQTALNFVEKYPELIEIDYLNILTQVNSKGESIKDKLENYKKTEDPEISLPITKSSVIFTYNDGINGENHKVVTDYMTSAGFSSFFTLDSDLSATSYNGEEMIAALVGWVMEYNHPTAYISIGHGERLSSAFSSILVCAGYDIKTVNLRSLSAEEVAKITENDENIFIISNPVTDFGASAAGSGVYSELDRLETIIKGGGHLYVTLDPYVSYKNLLNLTGFLADYGISVTSSASDGGSTFYNIVRDMNNSISADGYTVIADYADNSTAAAIKKATTGFGSGKILMREAAALECVTGNKGVGTEILVSSSSAVCEVNGDVTDREGSYCLAASTSVKIDGKQNPATIFVLSSAYVASNDIIITEGYSNKDFIYSVFDNIFSRKTPPYGCTGIVYNTGTLEGLTMGTARIYTVIALLIPTALAAVGAVVVLKRKRR